MVQTPTTPETEIFSLNLPKTIAMPPARSFDLRAADRERERAARRARIQNRWTILQIRYQLEASEPNRRALNDFLAFLQEYGE